MRFIQMGNGSLEHVELRSPDGTGKSSQLLINGNDFSNSCKAVKIECNVEQITEVILEMLPKKIIFEGGAIVSVLINDKKYELRERVIYKGEG